MQGSRKKKQGFRTLLKKTWKANFDDVNLFRKKNKPEKTSTNEQNEAIDNFIHNLLTSLDGKELTILQKESNILTYIEKNRESVLKELLNHDHVYIRSKESLYTFIYKRIIELINTVLLPVIKEYLKTIDFAFLSKCDRAKMKFSTPMDSYFSFLKRIYSV